MTFSTSDVAVCRSSASESSSVRASSFLSRVRARALTFFIASAAVSRDDATRGLAFVPAERTLRPCVRLFAPLRDTVTSSTWPQAGRHQPDQECLCCYNDVKISHWGLLIRGAEADCVPPPVLAFHASIGLRLPAIACRCGVMSWSRGGFLGLRPASGISGLHSSDLDWINAGLLPPGCLIAEPMHQAMMDSTERDRELIADLAAKRARLGEAKVMGPEGLRPQIRQGCEATNRRYSLLR